MMFRIHIMLILMALIHLCYGMTGKQYEKKYCKTNEEFRTCAKVCRPYCNQDHDQQCDLCHIKYLNCLAGCYCKPGFIREAVDTNNCIPEKNCKNLPKCRKDEVYKVCERICARSCENPEVKICDECSKGCFCKYGFIRSTNSVGSLCIPESKCPKVD